MRLPLLPEFDFAAKVVYSFMAPTPQFAWPLLSEKLRAQTWVKHENHTCVGAFKVRGGLVYFDALAREGKVRGVISATRGNHGQSVAIGAKRYGMACKIVVPFGNSVEKNAAMRALGVELIEHGNEFQEAREFAQKLAGDEGLHMVPSFHPLLVVGVGTYAMELFQAAADLDTVYVPIGMGSGICGMIAAREALGLTTKIVGVVSSHARAYALSFAEGKVVEAQVSTVLADGMACRSPDTEAVEIIHRYADRIIEVSDHEVAQAIRIMFECTHNVAEGAGAAALAGAFGEREKIAGKKIAVVLSGGNIDTGVVAKILNGA